MVETADLAGRQRDQKSQAKAQDDHIYGQMMSAILEQRLTPGTKLSEDVLGEIFGVSRTVVRKVLQRLAHEKVVQILPNRGAYVAEPSPAEARDVLEARRIVEAGVMRLAVANCTKTDIKRLESIREEEAQSIRNGQHSRWVALSGDFHIALAEIAGNAVLTDILRQLVSRTSLIHVQYQSSKMGNQSCNCDEHGELITTLIEKDEKKAVALMIDHLNACEEQLNLDGEEAVSDLYQIFSAAAD
ncbi:MAG: GntR family transcriptional regulator [Sneathiellales bacterium]|nr:GntR family transcriptional regulator [Sneathiellales bacterium]